MKLIKFKNTYRIVVSAICVSTISLIILYSVQDGRPPPPPSYSCLPNETLITTPLHHNLAIVSNYKFPGLDEYREMLGLDEKVPPVSRDVPVIGTGCSSNHFPESMQMLNNMKEKLYDSYDDVHIYFYDLGLEENQRKEIENFPRVHLRDFPFSEFPAHVSRLQGFAWKPIIMQLLLREFGFMVWMDASIRLVYANIDPIIHIARSHGVAFRSSDNWSLIPRTDIDTFKFLNENPCNFRNFGEIEGNFMLLYRTQFINDYIMKPVVSCALSYGCMVTKNSAAMLNCDGIGDHGCHRFDQAVFAIVFRRLFQNDPKYWVPPEGGVYVCRGPTCLKFLPDVIFRQITKLESFFDETNHARCSKGIRWYYV